MHIKRKDLEIFLQQIETIPELKLELEQYPTSSRVAANLLWQAGIENNDIYSKDVLDLGCGTGILALGASFLGARTVFGVDIDSDSLKIAKKNSKEFDLESYNNWICADVRNLHIKSCDTTIMNPPFGMRKESLSRDRDFLLVALDFSDVIYSINPYAEKTRDFFKRFCKEHSAEVDNIIKMDFELPKSYEFHKKRRHIFQVDLYRILKI